MSVDPLGPVVITAREIYDQLVRLTDGVTAMATGMAQIRDAVDDTKKDVADHEARIRALERGRWPLPSLAALVALASLAGTLIALMR